MKLKVKTDPTMALPEAYKFFLNVFSYKESNKLPLHCPEVDYTIYMQSGTQPLAGPLYGLNRDELQVFKKYLENNLSKGFIWTLSLSTTALKLFIKKPEGSLQFWVNYQGLNVVTIKNKYPMPFIRETLDQLCNVVYFSKLDIMATFNKIHIAAGNK